MSYSTSVTALLNTATGPISVRDFSYFLYYFRAAYVAAVHLQQQHRVPDVPSQEELTKLAKLVESELSHREPFKISNLALADLDADLDLEFTDINRQNPIDIVFSCVGAALAVAVIISGGEITWNKDGLHVKLPPLGKGIAELKKAMRGEKPKAIKGKSNDESSSA